jgi:hypothetical protein
MARTRDAELFSEPLIEGKRDSLQASTSLLVSALSALHRYGQAVHAQQYWIDFLKTSADDYDQVFVPAYTGLAGIYGEAGRRLIRAIQFTPTSRRGKNNYSSPARYSLAD